MAEFVDRNDIKRRIEFSPSVKDGWVKLTIETPAKMNYSMTWELPLNAAKELSENLQYITNPSVDCDFISGEGRDDKAYATITITWEADGDPDRGVSPFA